MKRKRLSSAALLAAITMLVAVGTASANHLRISSGTFRISWASLSMESRARQIHCQVTLEGSFHSATIAKVLHALIGHVTRAISANAGCTGGKIFMLNGTEVINGQTVGNTLPWPVQYSGFFGALPAILGVDAEIVGAAFLVEIEPLTCLYRSTGESPWIGTFELGSNRRITGFRSDEVETIPRFNGALCPETISVSNSGGVQVLGSTAAITITLI